MNKTLSFLLCIFLSVNGREIFFMGTPKVNPGSLYHYSHNPFERNYGSFFPKPMSYESSNSPSMSRTVLTQARMQSAVMAENYLKSSRDIQCTQKSFCDAAAQSGSFDNAKATYSSVNVLNQMLKEVSEYSHEFPQISSLVAAFTVGSTTRNATICKWLFTCSHHTPQNEGRVNCKTASSLCPGISISCALCAMVAPDTCGAVCPIAALYCGTSGYACMNNDSEVEMIEDEGNDEEDQKEDEEMKEEKKEKEDEKEDEEY